MIMARKVLFICYANRPRSPAAVRVFSELLVEKGYKVFGRGIYSNPEFEVTSAGVCADDDGNELTEEHLATANQIFFMHQSVLSEAERYYKIPKEKSVVMDIPDIYGRDSNALEDILHKQLEPYV